MGKEKLRRIIKKNRGIRRIAVGCLTAAALFALIFAFYNRHAVVENTQTEEKTVLIVTFASGDDGWNRSVSLVCAAFMEKYPEIEVRLQPSTGRRADFTTTI